MYFMVLKMNIIFTTIVYRYVYIYLSLKYSLYAQYDQNF